MQTLYSLYAAQLATIAWIQEGKNSPDVERRNIIVGLGLRKSENAGGDREEHEKNVFEEVMNMLYRLLLDDVEDRSIEG